MKMLNKTILIGRISTDLELRETNSGNSTVKFNLAVNRIKEGTDFIPVQVWGKQAENIVQYQSKGSLIAVEGSIRIDEYTDSDGNNRRFTYVLAQNVKFLDKKTSGQASHDEEDVYSEFGDSVEIDDNFLE